MMTPASLCVREVRARGLSGWLLGVGTSVKYSFGPAAVLVTALSLAVSHHKRCAAGFRIKRLRELLSDPTKGPLHCLAAALRSRVDRFLMGPTLLGINMALHVFELQCKTTFFPRYLLARATS